MTEEESQWTSPGWWGQAYWKGKWNGPEVTWERPPEEDIPSNAPSSGAPDEANAETKESWEPRKSWDWNHGWSRGWDCWDWSNRGWDWSNRNWDWSSRDWEWSSRDWEWDWKPRWSWWGWDGWDGWGTGWGSSWGWDRGDWGPKWWGDRWSWRNDGWNRGWEPDRWQSSWQDSWPVTERQGWWDWDGQGGAESPEAGQEERQEVATVEETMGDQTQGNRTSGPAISENQDPGPGLFAEPGGARLPSIPEQPNLEEASPSAEVPLVQAPVSHPHENEEWYQKWLQRQRQQPGLEIGAPPAPASPSAATPEAPAASSSSGEAAPPPDPVEKRKVCPDDGKTYTFDELREAYKGEYSEEDLQGYWRDAMVQAGKPAETSKEDYKQEEWYQKWLRRQQNKNRQIIEIG